MKAEGSVAFGQGTSCEGVPLPRGNRPIRQMSHRRHRDFEKDPAFPRVDLTRDPVQWQPRTKRGKDIGPRQRRSDAGQVMRVFEGAELQALLDAYTNGVPLYVILRTFKTAQRTIDRVVKEHGAVRPNRATPKVTSKECEVCGATFEQGKTRNDVWKVKVTCSRVCAGTLAARRRNGQQA